MAVRRRSIAGFTPTRGSGRAALAGACAASLALAVAGCSSGVGRNVRSARDYDHACADGRGFAGSTTYAPTRGAVHPAALVTKISGSWTQVAGYGQGYPAGWLLGVNDDPGRAQLVVCFERTKAIPTGRTCQMVDDDTNQSITVTVYNTEYRLRVLDARTGRVLSDRTSQARATSCPTVTINIAGEDRTKYYQEAHPSDYRDAVAPFIAP